MHVADIHTLLAEAWPEAESLEFNWWDMSRRNLSLWASLPFSGREDTGSRATAWRWLYFDGENLLVYRDNTTYTDHVADTVDQDIPAEILEEVKARVQSYMEQLQDMAWDESLEAIDSSPQWDDWRITSLELVDTVPAYPELGLRIYSFGYQLHTPVPERVVQAGAASIDEDGWMGGLNTDPYLVFHTMTNSGPTLLESYIPTDVSRNSPIFAAGIAQTILENGLLQPSEIRDEDLYYLFYNNQTTFLNLLGTYDSQECSQALQRLAVYAVSMAGAKDGELFSQGLQNLEWNSSALTEAGRRAYEQLLQAVEQASTMPTEPEALLESFTANPSIFLRQASLLSAQEQSSVCQALAVFYDGGTSAQQARFSDALHSVKQQDLDAASTAVYELLRTSCALPGPAARTAAEEDAMLEAAQAQLTQWQTFPGVVSLQPLELSVDEAETAGIVQRYTASLTANENGWSDTDTARMTAVLAVFDLELDQTYVGPDLAAMNWNEGTNARLIYLMPSAEGDTWEIVDSTSCAVPEKFLASDDSPSDQEIRDALLADYHAKNPTSAPEGTLVYETEAHKILSQERSGNTYSVYLVAWRATFTMADGKYNLTSGDRIPTALTFSWENGQWQLTEYWIPGDGGAYADDLRSKFPAEAAEQELNSDLASAISQDLMTQCYDDAVRYFARTTGTVPARTFTRSDVEFRNQALSVETDPMTYEERLAWAQNPKQDEAAFQLVLTDYVEGEGCIAYTGYWAGTPHMDQNALSIRFADGTRAALPLPQSYEMGVAAPDTMEFSEGTFRYTIAFSQELLTNEGQSLLHLAGTYCYTVNLSTKTVSLTVQQ